MIETLSSLPPPSLSKYIKYEHTDFHKRIMVPVDDSPYSEAALDWAIENVLHKGDLLVISHVISDKDLDAFYANREENKDKIISILEKQAQQYLNEVRGRFEKFDARHGNPDIIVDIQVGQPQQKICDVAKELKVDTIVVGSHGKGTAKKHLLGSTTAALMTDAPCQVLVAGTKSQHYVINT